MDTGTSEVNIVNGFDTGLFETPHGATATTVGNFNGIFGNCLNCIGATVAMVVIVFYGHI